jgi:hypothetical protein
VSSIAFRRPSGEPAYVRGTERAWFGMLTNRVAIGLLDPRMNLDLLKSALPADHWAHSDAERMALHLSVGDVEFEVEGERYENFSIALNTCLTVGNDALRLAARLHGQCEIHTWVDGPNRAWLADIIEAADESIIRPGSGWDEVVALLRERDDEPVVTSYSVTEGFPNPYDSDWMPAWPDGIAGDYRLLSEAQQLERDARSDAWYDLDESEQWGRGLRWLSAAGGGLEMKPENWSTMRFRHKLNAMQFLDLLRERQRSSIPA